MSTDPTELVEIEDRVFYNLRLYDKIDQEKVWLICLIYCWKLNQRKFTTIFTLTGVQS